MTESKAIEVLQTEKLCVKSVDCLREECKSCNLVMPEHDVLEAYDKAIEALEKQEPMRPNEPELGIFPRHPIITPCGNCGEELKDLFWDYCPWCGQRIKR